MRTSKTPSLRRRQLLAGVSALAAAPLAGLPAGRRKFYSAFVPGSIGVKAGQALAIELAGRHGFESVQPFPRDLERDGVENHLRALAAAGLRWAAAGLAVDFRGDDGRFEQGLAALHSDAAVLQRAGATRVGTWLPPASERLTYLQNFRRTSARLREVAEILGEHGLRLGLEYVGTKRNWTRSRYAFVHTMAEAKELIAEIGSPNVGLVLDSWHWWTARESGGDIAALSAGEIVAADLNDAPAGIERDDQYDNQRELPLATGVIPVKEFLAALVEAGFDGPIRAEPFSKRLSAMDDEDASRLTGQAMREALALVG